MTEIWFKIKGYKGNYKVSNFGNVLSMKKVKYPHVYPGGPYLQQFICSNGESAVHLGAACETHIVSHLVASAFVPNPKKYTRVIHKDGNRQNNRADNLAWVEDTPRLPFRENPTDDLIKVLGYISKARETLKDATRKDGAVDLLVNTSHLNTLAAEIAEYIGGRVAL